MRTLNLTALCSLAALSLAALTVSGCSGSAPDRTSSMERNAFRPASKGREARLSKDTLAGFGYHEAWDSEIGSSIEQIWFLNNDLYVESARDGGGYNLLKIEGDSGLTVWTYGLSEKLRFEPCIYEYPEEMRATNATEMFIVQDHRVECLREDSGLKLYDIKCEGAISTAPTASNDFVYVGFWSNYMNAYGKVSQIREGWYIADSELVAAGVVGKEKFYFGSEDTKVYGLGQRCEFSQGDSWIAKTNGRVTSTPTFYQNQVFVGSHDYKVYCFDTFNGAESWSYNSIGPVPGRLFPFKDYIFANSALESLSGPIEHTLTSLNSKTGRSNWSRKNLSRVLAADALHCYATLDGSEITKLSHSDGSVDRTIDTSEFEYVVGQDAKQGSDRDRWGRIYLATRDGYIQLIQPRR